MDHATWQPRSTTPDDLVLPVGVDPQGRNGPTRHQARGPRWRQTSAGRYVPSTVDETRVEQRILEQGCRVRSHGAVTGWASLRWWESARFDGRALDGSRAPVPIVTGGSRLRGDGRVTISQEQLAPPERVRLGALQVTVPPRAVFDEIRRHRNVREGAVDIDMTVAAGVCTWDAIAQYIRIRNAWTGIGLAREALALSGNNCRSPQEVRMVLVWMLDAGLPRPMCNVPLFDHAGRLLAIADLFDPETGCVGEYQGLDHKSGERHRRDVAREQRLRDAGLECFEVVGGDLRDRPMVAARMRSARQRASYMMIPRGWTLERPGWWAEWATARGLTR